MASAIDKYRAMYTSAGGPKAPGSGGGSPFGAMFSGGAGQPAPQPQMAQARPQGGFNALLDPNNGGLFGLIGKMSGAPTREEWLFQKAGSASRTGLEGLSTRMQTMSPQAAIVDFIGSPEGMEFFASVPNAADEIKRHIGLLVPEAADPTVLSQGQQAFNPDGSVAFENPAAPQTIGPGQSLVGQDGSVIHQQPTTEVQDFQGLAQLANLPLPEIEKLAKAQIVGKQTGDLTQTQEAVAQLVASGQMSPLMGQKVLAGIISWQPMQDASGATSGYALVDMTNPSAPQVITSPQATQNLPANPGDPNYAPGVTDDGYDPDKNAAPGALLQDFANPADIVEGAGLTAQIGDVAGGLMGELIPGMSNSGRTYAKYRRGLNQIRNDARAFKESNRYTKDDTAVLDSLMPLTTEATVNPIMAADALIKYRQWLEQRITAAGKIASDVKTTGKARGEAILELNQLDKGIANVPTIEQLEGKIMQLEALPGSPFTRGIREGAANIGQSIGVVEKGIEQGTIEPDAVRDYPDAKSVQDAFYKGLLKMGQKVTIGGKPFTLRMPQADNRGRE